MTAETGMASVPRYVLGVDAGTTSVKAVLCDAQRGTIVAEASRPVDLISRRPGWAEEDPEQWWRGAVESIRELMGSCRAAAGDVAAVGVSGMVPALVVLDGAGRPLRLSIQQNDARTAAEIEWFRGVVDEKEYFRITGGSVNQQSIPPKLRWLSDNEPGVFGAARWFLGSYDYVNYRLTGNLSIERNWALESGFLDIATAGWHTPYMDAVGVRPGQFPELRDPVAVVGEVTADVAEMTGLRAGTPVVAGCADHVASAFAAGLVDHGDLNIKFGGAGDILFCLDQLDTDPRLFIDYHLIPGKFLINGCMAASGSALRWFARGFAGGTGIAAETGTAAGSGAGAGIYEQLDAAAAELEPGSDSLIVLPYFIGEKTPIHDPLARGVFFGLSLHHSPVHVHRAIMEAVVYGFRHHVDVLAELGHEAVKVVATDGGARSKLWRQISADVLGRPVLYRARHPGSALGAAFVAGMAVGIFSDWSEIETFSEVTDVTEPDAGRSAVYSELYGIYREIYPALRPSFVRLSRAGAR